MNVTFSGVSIGFGSTDMIEISGNIQQDNINISHESDGLGKITTVSVNGQSICVETDTLTYKTTTH